MNNDIKKIIDILDGSIFKWQLESDPAIGDITIRIREVNARSYNRNLGRRVSYQPYPLALRVDGATLTQYDEILFDTRADAESALEWLKETLNTYGVVTVSDLFDIAGRYYPDTDLTMGWVSLYGSQVHRIKHGYTLWLPRPRPV